MSNKTKSITQYYANTFICDFSTYDGKLWIFFYGVRIEIIYELPDAADT